MFSKYTTLKYQVTEVTNLAPDVLIDRVVKQVQSNGGKIIVQTNHSILFKENRPLLRSNWRAFTNIDEGGFEIISQEKNGNSQIPDIDSRRYNSYYLFNCLGVS